MKNLAVPHHFAQFLRQCCRHEWVVYAKRPFGGPEHVLEYLGNYTHRVPISNHRLVGLAEGRVQFRWRDSARHNKKRVMSLPVEEFLRRFFLHVLPRGFVRIRHFGFLSNRRRQDSLQLCRTLLAVTAAPPDAAPSATAASSFWACPICGSEMVIIERLAFAEVRVRPPPTNLIT
jgi:hypothetical protein